MPVPVPEASPIARGPSSDPKMSHPPVLATLAIVSKNISLNFHKNNF